MACLQITEIAFRFANLNIFYLNFREKKKTNKHRSSAISKSFQFYQNTTKSQAFIQLITKYTLAY